MISKTIKVIVSVLFIALFIIGILVVFSFVPFPGNYKVFTVQSGSMEPSIHTGSLIFAKPKEDYNVGDIVTRKTTDPKKTITHRIFSKEKEMGETFYETKGDANSMSDSGKFSGGEIIGKTIFYIPYLGYPVSFARTTSGLILIVIIPAVIIIYDEMNKIKVEIARKMDYKKRAAKRSEKLENNEEEKEI